MGGGQENHRELRYWLTPTDASKNMDKRPYGLPGQERYD